MMLNDKRFTKFLIFCFIYILLTILFIMAKTSDENFWFSNWFFDKFYIFRFSIIYLLGCSMIDKYFNYMTFSRMSSRKKYLANHLIQQYGFACVYINILFIFIIAASFLLFGKPDESTITYILNWYFRYLLGLLMMANLSTIFSRSNFKILSTFPHFCVFLISSLELITFKKLFHIGFIFSWIFEENTFFSYFFLLSINITLIIYLFQISSSRDLSYE